MFKKLSLVGAAVVMGATSLIPATPALAHDGYYRDYGDDDRDYRDGRYYRGDRYYRGERRYRGYRCDRGTGGLIIGAIAGGLLGREVVGHRGDRAAGTIIGAGVGAIAGREIDRSNSRRC